MQLFSSPFARRASDMVIKPGPLLPHTTPFDGIVTAGDLAALELYDGPSPSLLVVRLSTSEVWQISSSTGNQSFVLGMTDNELIVGHRVNASGSRFDYLRRYDLSRLGEYATLMPPL